MACESCVQKILAANDQDNAVIQAAQNLADECGEWVAVYRDGSGQLCYQRAADAAGIYIIRYITPQLQLASA